MTLSNNVTSLATRIGNYLRDSVLPRLLPTGGAANAVLAKSSATNFAVGWVAPRYDICMYAQGKPNDSEILMIFKTPAAFTLPASLTGSQAQCGTGAAATATVTIRRNGSNIGSVSFATGATSGTFTFATATTFAVGDRLELVAQATQDTALADIAIVLAATR